MTLLSSVAAGVVLFTLTDLDDLLLLVTFFADPRYAAFDVVAGQFAGMAAIMAASIAVSLTALAVPPAAVGLLGLVPIALGLRALVRPVGRQSDAGGAGVVLGGSESRGRIATVAAVTLSNGGDNIATYGPYLATRGPGEAALFVLVVFGMTALWCAVALRLLRQRTTLAIVGQVGGKALPFVLIGLGLSILWRENTFGLLGFR